MCPFCLNPGLGVTVGRIENEVHEESGVSYTHSQLVALRSVQPVVEELLPFCAALEIICLSKPGFDLIAEDWESVTHEGGWVRTSPIQQWIAHLNQLLGPGSRWLITSTLLQLGLFHQKTSAPLLGKQWRERHHNKLQFLLVPVNLRNVHWVALIIDLCAYRVELWDSLGSTQWPRFIVKSRLEEFLGAFCRRKTWTYVIPAVPHQQRSNCGVFMLEFFRAFICGYSASDFGRLESVVNKNQMSKARHLIAVELTHRQYRFPIDAFEIQFTMALCLRRCFNSLDQSFRRRILVLAERYRLVLFFFFPLFSLPTHSWFHLDFPATA